MGGMHRTMNYMGDIGRVMEENGFDDIVVEAKIYGPSVVNAILKDKAYNCGVCLHKLMNEAMNRLKWMALGDSFAEDAIASDEREAIAEKASRCAELFGNLEGQEDNKSDLQEALKEFITIAYALDKAMEAFVIVG